VTLNHQNDAATTVQDGHLSKQPLSGEVVMLVGARGPPLCRAVVSLTVKTMRAKRGLLENGGASLACEARLPRASSLPTRPGVPVSACL
jgi:hypothetical protein